jgi:hypothetical protein
MHELGGSDQTMPKGNFLHDIWVVARTAEPLVDDIDEPKMVGAIDSGVDEIRAVDVEDDEV